MARSYSVKTTALTLGVAPKWVDNVLSHHRIPGVVSERQGVERSISDLGIKTLEIVRLLVQELHVPTSSAVQIATSISASHENGAFRTPSGVEIRVDTEALDRRLRDRLMDAVEATPRLQRGRPKKQS